MIVYWTIITGILVSVIGAILGTYLVLRKMTMIGDAISHAVLPGITVAFLFTNSMASLPMLIGAAAVGLLATFVIETFQRKGSLQSDAAIGLTFTFFFAIGVIMVSRMSRSVHFDLDCVLYGNIIGVPFEPGVLIAGLRIPDTVMILGVTLIAIVAIVIIGRKGLYLTTFDPAYAAAIGVSTALWHYLLMGTVSLATVVSFESVGAILIVAFLIVPAATAYLLTDKFKVMMGLSILLGITAAIGGYFFSVWINGSITAAMVVVAGIQFVLAMLFSPSQGLLLKRKRFKNKVVIDSV